MVEINPNPEEDAMKIVYLHPGDVLGDWTVLDKIGEGGFGAVYLVKDSKGNECAMKTESVKATAKVNVYRVEQFKLIFTKTMIFFKAIR
ncbi:unnamed protein product [Brugia timori]|uniref:Protein kinase domain-containing protein n=1 Tax=Brugia timori TaxID=42155 RepID=A0A0R3R411_9BILA|nr:unnamed protein product [Brugia timori]